MIVCSNHQAKEMVELSRSIANKIKDKQGDITEDEVIIWLVKSGQKYEDVRCSFKKLYMQI